MKGRILLALLMVCMIAQSCSREAGSRPEIKKDDLVNLLVDIHIVDGYLIFNGSRIDRDRDRIEGTYGYVLRKHNVTPLQFNNTMKYYSRHIADYEQIYNKVIEKLTLYETESLNDGGNNTQSPESMKKKDNTKSKE